MSFKTAILLSSIVGIAAVSAQPVLPGFDFTKVTASYAGGMNLDDGSGEMELYQFEARSALSPPISVTDSFTILPIIQYKATRLNFKGQDAAFPIEDEDLHSISLSSFFLYNRKSSPWIFGAWTRAELASDFQDVDSDDVTFDVVAGVAYKISDTLTVGIGAAAVNINNDAEFFAGLAVDWKPNDCFRAGLYGPNFVASWTPGEDWELSLRGDASGDEWNIRDAAGNSTNIDLDSYRVGLYGDRRLTGDLWLRVGAGITVMNQINSEKTNGTWLSHDEPEGGWFGEIGIRLKTW